MCYGVFILILVGNIDFSIWNFEVMFKCCFCFLRMCFLGVGIWFFMDCLKVLNNFFVFGVIWDWFVGFSFLCFEGEEFCFVMRGCS